MRSWTTTSPETTRELGRELGRELAAGATVLLVGDLGSGKTVFVRGVAEALGIRAEEVQSPTFTLIREHTGERGRLTHVDLYRLASEDVLSLGLEELLMATTVTVIEWADRLPFEIPADLALEMRRTESRGERLIHEIDSQDAISWGKTTTASDGDR